MDKPLSADEWHERLTVALRRALLPDAKLWEFAGFLASFDPDGGEEGEDPSLPIARKLLELTGRGRDLSTIVAREMLALDLDVWLTKGTEISAFMDGSYRAVYRAIENGNLPLALGGVKRGPDGLPVDTTSGDRYVALPHALYARIWRSRHDAEWRKAHWPEKY